MRDVIEVNHLKFNYRKRGVLKDVSFKVGVGKVVGLIGENGAGKTTLLKVLLGFLPDHGRAKILNSTPRLNYDVSSMMQGDLKLPGVTVQDILEETAAQSTSSLDIERVLKELDMMDLIHQRLTSLSGGQLRRVSFAMALIPNTRLVFLDEPTVGMDVNSRQRLWQKIDDLKKEGKTILITSHYLNELEKIADQILILKDGKIAFDGSFNELQSKYLMTTISFKTELGMDNFTNIDSLKNIRKKNGIIYIKSRDGDRTLQALLPLLNELHQISITRESLEKIFISMSEEELTDEKVNHTASI
ncbi:ABC transporter ATP-binding protein [Pediococcus stilesii]|nr:ABC transporter ATP-binding protein [Pediococcus stilesii]